MAKNVIWGDTDLAEVAHFTNNAFLGSSGWIAVFIDDRWALSTEFEDARNKVLSAGLGDKLTFGRGPSKDDHVESHGGDLDGYLGVSLNDSVKSLIKILFTQLRGGNRTIRRKF